MAFLKWIGLGVLLLPFLELAAFIAVATAVGFGVALALIVLGSLCGMLLLRYAGGGHIARIRTAVNDGSFTSLQANGPGGLLLLGGILLLIPGFITDAAALLVLLFPATRMLAEALRMRPPPARRPPDGVLDLEPEQWHHVPDPRLPNRNDRP
jgi:UPF0716 protein FxsA